MNWTQSPQAVGYSAAQASVDARSAFIMRTYLHLVGAVLAFIALEVAFFTTGAWLPIANTMLQANMFLLLIAFVGAGWLAQSWARSQTSPAMQYLGLGLYVVVEAIIFVPLLAIAETRVPGVITSAALVSIVVFGGLSGVVFLTRRDFSFLRGILGVSMLVAIGTVAASLLFGFNLGVFFSAAMCLIAAGYILYDTSNILHHYRTDQHVGAALELFASLALLFYYVLRLMMQSRR